MKIIINKNGKLEDVPDKVASRLINKGKAHPAPEIPFNDFIPSKKEQKIIDEHVEKIDKPIKKAKRSRKKKAIKFKPISVSTDFEDHLRELM